MEFVLSDDSDSDLSSDGEFETIVDEALLAQDRREERGLFSMASGYGRARGRGVTQ